MNPNCTKGIQLKKDIEDLISKKETLTLKEYKKQLKIIRFKLLKLIASGNCSRETNRQINKIYRLLLS